MFQNWVLHLNPHLFSSSFFFFFWKEKKNPFSRLVFLPIFLDQPYHFDFHSFLVGLCLWDGEETTVQPSLLVLLPTESGFLHFCYYTVSKLKSNLCYWWVRLCSLVCKILFQQFFIKYVCIK